jgi:hypothetical protein
MPIAGVFIEFVAIKFIVNLDNLTRLLAYDIH